MKRFIILLIITAACIAGLLSARGILPLASAFGPGIVPVFSFLQSQTGMITVVTAMVILAILLFGREILRLGNLLLLAVFAPIINEEKRINRSLSRQIEANEKKISATETALKEFSAAVAEYAHHLSSHTSAIKGLSDASQELKRGGAAQNRFLENLIKNTEERLVSKNALLATMKVNTTSPDEAAPDIEKSTRQKSRPSYRALHPQAPVSEAIIPEEPAPEARKTVFEKANLVEAMVLPYYRALNKLESGKTESEDQKPSGQSEKSKTEAKKAVEQIMMPLYKTLYQSEKQNDPDTTKSRRKTTGSTPPGCARLRHPLKPW